MSSPHPTPPAAAPAAAPWRRYLLVGGPLLVAAAAAGLWYLPAFRLSQDIKALVSENPETQRQVKDRLRSDARPEVDAKLEAGVADSDLAFQARVQCVDLLLARGRLTKVEQLLRSGDLMTRAVILKRLARESYFETQVVPDPSFRVKETVLAWLADSSAERRMEAIRLALDIRIDQAMDSIRPLLVRGNAEGAGKSDTVFTLIAAAESVVTFKDCGSVDKVAVLADSDPDVEVRLRTLEALERLCLGVGGGAPVCPDALPPERLAAIVAHTLDAGPDADFARKLRIKGLSMIQRHPKYLEANRARVRAALDGDGNGAERRSALAALADGADPQLLKDLARYAHDREFEVRDELCIVLGRLSGVTPEGLWIGLLRDETRSLSTMLLAAQQLRRAAGRWVGLPEALAASEERRPADFDKALDAFLQDLFRQGSSAGLGRDAWADAWFAWFAQSKAGLSGEALEAAQAARRAFRLAMDRNDATAAQAALAGAKDAPAGLLLYEQGWLDARRAR